MNSDMLAKNTNNIKFIEENVLKSPNLVKFANTMMARLTKLNKMYKNHLLVAH